MAQKAFGTGGTIKKLQTIADYLQFYTTALGGKFRLNYVDPFAGAGEVPLRGNLPLFDGIIDYDKVMAGSAKKALEIEPPFDKYWLGDIRKANVSALSELKSAYPKIADRVHLQHGEANQIVEQYCKQHDPNRDRAVLFLDPFGNQVSWSTLETVARTKGIDLWYLFPSGLGVARQISQDAKVQKDSEDSLNQMFGDRSWFEASTRQTGQLNFLDADYDERSKMKFTADAITKHLIAKMKGIFSGIVLDVWLPLGGNGGHWYSLLFACSNDSKPAKDLARRVANDIMKRK
jgi:three-Cys-motif partner protein